MDLLDVDYVLGILTLFQSLRTAMRPAMSVSATGMENKLFGKGFNSAGIDPAANCSDDEVD